MALIASNFGGVCYDTVQQANDAYYSQILPNLLVRPTVSYLLEYVPHANGVYTLKKSSISSTGTIKTVFDVAVTPPVFPSCDPAQPYLDGMQLGWGVVGAMVAATAVIFLKRAFF